MTGEELACEAYAVVDDILQGYHQKPSVFGIDAPCPAAVDHRRAYREYEAELRDGNGQRAEKTLLDAMPPLNSEQADVADAVVRCINNSEISSGPSVFYVDGPAGAGKTFLYTWLLRHVRASGGIALVVAMSGA